MELSAATTGRKAPRSTDDTGAVPTGYKKTGVGVIPEDWDHLCVGNVARVKGGKRLPPGFALVDGPTPHPYVRVADMHPGGVDAAGIKYVPEAAFPAIQSYRIYGEDIFISVAGTLGIVGVVPPELSGANLTENADRITELRCERDFLKYWLMSAPIQQAIESIRTVGAQPKLALGRIAKFDIAVPRGALEQRAIAESLSDVDGLLAALESLIAKKRAIKQGAMQQLLTGKTRLPGFSGDWETRRLGEILTFQVGCPFSSRYFSNAEAGLRLIKNRDLKADDEIVHYNGPYTHDYLITNGDVLVGMDGDFIPCMWTGGAALLNQRVGRLRASSNLDVRFAYYFLRKPLKEIERATSSTTVKHLSHGDVEGITGVMPEVIEQAAIATVLSDMDAEIAALERRRDKTRGIKQGMMQQLLTGRVRLVEPQRAEGIA